MNAFLDLETGGLDPAKNPILEIGAVCGGEQFECHLIPNTLLEIDPEGAAISGWTEAPMGAVRECEAIPSLLGWLRKRGVRTILAYNTGFDAAFLKAAFGRCGFNIRNIDLRFQCVQSMFSLAIARGEYSANSNSLNAAIKFLLPDAPPRQTLHSALEDAILCEAVYNKLVAPRYQTQQQPTTPTVRTGWGRMSSRL